MSGRTGSCPSEMRGGSADAGHGSQREQASSGRPPIGASYTPPTYHRLPPSPPISSSPPTRYSRRPSGSRPEATPATASTSTSPPLQDWRHPEAAWQPSQESRIKEGNVGALRTRTLSSPLGDADALILSRGPPPALPAAGPLPSAPHPAPRPEHRENFSTRSTDPPPRRNRSPSAPAPRETSRPMTPPRPPRSPQRSLPPSPPPSLSTSSRTINSPRFRPRRESSARPVRRSVRHPPPVNPPRLRSAWIAPKPTPNPSSPRDKASRTSTSSNFLPGGSREAGPRSRERRRLRGGTAATSPAPRNGRVNGACRVFCRE